MRWKLLFIVSILATLVGAGISIGVIVGLFGTTNPFTAQNRFVLGTLIIPLAAIVFASIFVYRHTSRRRKLQALLTAILASALTLTTLLLSSLLLRKAAPAPTPVNRPINVG